MMTWQKKSYVLITWGINMKHNYLIMYVHEGYRGTNIGAVQASTPQHCFPYTTQVVDTFKTTIAAELKTINSHVKIAAITYLGEY